MIYGMNLVHPIIRILVLILSFMLPHAALSASLPTFEIPLRVFIISEMDMNKAGQRMYSWVSAADIEHKVLPEVNRIWKPAGIKFSLESVQAAPAFSHKNKVKILRYVENAKRDKNGKADPKRIKKLQKLTQGVSRLNDGITAFIVPYLGEKSQGNASGKKRRIFIGQWTDKYRKGGAPERFQLIEYGKFKQGSFSRTLAHEIGHILGLRHPVKSSQVHFSRLMGGKKPGIQLTPEEIARARGLATKLVQ